jgi:hypothetical protein
MSKRKTQPTAKVETKKGRRKLWIAAGVFVLAVIAASGTKDSDSSKGGTPASIYLTDRARVTTVPTLAAARSTKAAVDVPTDTVEPTSAPTDTTVPPTAVPFTPDFTPQTGLSATTVPTTYYVISEARLRSCAGTTSCAIITTLYAGAPVTVIATVNGEEVKAGNAIWYLTDYNGSESYIYSDLVTLTVPAAPVTTGGNSSGSSANGGISTAPPLMSTPSQSPFGCNGMDDLNCGDFYAIGQNANAHLAQCGDEDRLDGDGDGRACER